VIIQPLLELIGNLRRHQLLCARLRPSNVNDAGGTLEEVKRIVV
jgi:hypothetical protein